MEVSEDKMQQLLDQFNERKETALSSVYNYYYKEFHYFASKLYIRSEIQPSDVVHDVIIKIWGNKQLRFNSLENIKAYTYRSIKNSFVDYVRHSKSVEKYNMTIIDNAEYYISEIVESEIMSTISEISTILPSEIQEIFKLIVDGWTLKEISIKLNIPLSSVYAKKNQAIEAIKQKLNLNAYFW